MKHEIIHKNGGTWEVNLSRRDSTKYKCYDCSGFNWSDVRNCPHKRCPLFPFRTGKGKQNPKDRIVAIKLYCMYCMDYNYGEIKLCTSHNCPLYPYRGYATGIITPEFLEKNWTGYFINLNYKKLYPNTDIGY